MFGLGYPELIVILILVLLFFGGAKLPELAKGFGKAMREFKKAKDGVHDEIEKELKKDESKKNEKDEDKKDAPKPPVID